ncbi:hypothetical protein [Polymorphospora sp. NPDC050346]|uniref:hypothetical protein n=1 Tax=Polymorphospora sp. NPDC050346 TaxID=3155780 RepID=UPI00340EE342
MLTGLAGNPALPADLLDRLVALADTALGELLADRADLSGPQVRALVARCGSPVAARLARRGLLGEGDPGADDPEVRLVLLDTTGGPERWARELARHPDPSVRTRLAAARHVPADVLAVLAEDADVDVVTEVALSAAPVRPYAETLARHPHTQVRRALALNGDTPPHLLAALATDGGRPAARFCPVCQPNPEPYPGRYCGGGHESAVSGIREAAARNPATPPGAVAPLIADGETFVRWALAGRHDLPPDAYRRLAVDPIPGVRGEVAANPAIDESLMWEMAADLTYGVRRELAHNPRVPIDVLVRLAATTRIGPTPLRRISSASAAEIELLAGSAVPAVRMLLAQRADLPATVIDALAADPDAKVVASIAANPVLTAGRLRSMVDRHGTRVSFRVAANPACPAGLLHHIAVHAPARKALREIARHANATAPALLRCLDDDRARPVAARHPALPARTVVELLADPDPDVVEAAAANPSLPRPAMESLLSGTAQPGAGAGHVLGQPATG